LPGKTLTAQHWAAVAEAVWARIADLQWSVRRVGQLSGLSVNTIQGVLHASGHPNKSTLVALSAVLEWDPQHLSGIAHGRAANVPRETSLASLLVKQIRGLRADLARLTESTRRTGMKIDVLTSRIDTPAGQRGSRPHRETRGLAPDDSPIGTRPWGLAVKRAASPVLQADGSGSRYPASATAPAAPGARAKLLRAGMIRSRAATEHW
jgi:hypothetical protein